MTLVRTSLGIGRVVQRGAADSVVEFFDHAGQGGESRLTLPNSSMTPASITSETRVHLPSDHGWRQGRVMDHLRQDGMLYVKLEGTGIEQRIPEDQVRIRWNKRLADPCDQLSAFAVGSRRFHSTRSRFVGEYRRRRQRFSGLSAVASASVELHAHQVEAARRVLHDPIQRYLLADEVGLGKTIEAGVIMRQHLLDGERSDILVVVPTHLLEQWETEVDLKLRLREEFPFRVRITDPAGVSRLDAEERAELGLLVVDEAHEIVRDGDAAEDVCAIARATPKLLLITATPVMSDVDRFYRLLNLLSPSAHPLGDLDHFRRILDVREAVGEALAVLADDDGVPPPGFLVREGIGQLREAIPDDPALSRLLDEVISAVGGNGDLGMTLAAARAHVSETHRIHSRMVRSRRASGLAAGYPVLGRSLPVLIESPSARPDELVQAWRTSLAIALDRSELISPRDASRWVQGLEAACASLPTLRSWCERTLAQDDTSDSERKALEGIQSALAQIGDCPRIGKAVEVALDAAADGDPVAIACLSDGAAQAVLDGIRSRAPKLKVGSITGSGASDALAFERGDIDVIVLGPAGEQGHNLQRTQTVVHAELPWNANRLEQRIGRFDRFGVGAAAAMHMAISDGLATLDGAWQQCLVEGFGIFETSAASIQDVIDHVTPQIVSAAIHGGPSAIVAAIPEVQSAVAAARKRLANEEALDGINLDPLSRRCLAALEDVDGNESVDPWRAAVTDWATSGGISGAGLRFTCRRVAGLGRRVSIGMSHTTLPLIPLDHLRAKFSGAFGVDKPWFEAAFNRGTACRRHLRLLEPGDPFIEALWDFTQIDDRGRSFATWRSIPTLDEGTRGLWWMFDVIFEPDVREAILATGASDNTTALSIVRRAEVSLEPATVRVWIDGAGNVEQRTGVLNMLQPADAAAVTPGAVDQTLRPSHRPLIDELIARDDWQETVRGARLRAVEHARIVADIASRGDIAAREALTSAHEAAARARARSDADSEHAAAKELAIGSAIAKGMQNPAVEIDACGIVILASEPMQRTSIE